MKKLFLNGQGNGEGEKEEGIGLTVIIFINFRERIANYHRMCYNIKAFAGVVKLADTLDLGSSASRVQVQVLSPAPV